MQITVKQGRGANQHAVGSVGGHTVRTGGTSLTMHLDDESLEQWNRRIYGMIEAAGQDGHRAVDAAVKAVLNNSYLYVPRETNTLAESGYARTETTTGIKLSAGLGDNKRETIFVGVVGYGSDEETGTINPKTGLRPSQYAWKVHEDLSAKHPNGGQAKFLERAFREYAMEIWPNEMVNLERTIYTGTKYKPIFSYSSNAKAFHGWGKETKTDRSKENISNYDRLKGIYEGAK